MYWMYSCLSAWLDYTLRLAKVCFQVTSPSLQYLQEECCVLVVISLLWQVKIHCQQSALQPVSSPRLSLLMLVEQIFWANVFGWWVWGFFSSLFILELYSLSLLLLLYLLAFLTTEWQCTKLECVSWNLLFWNSGKPGSRLQICSQTAFHGGLACVRFSSYKYHSIFLLREKKVCFTKTNASNALGKES